MRYAVYYTPDANHPLNEAASQWLGRNALTGRSQTISHNHSDLVTAPNRYGFHATMKAPFRLNANRDEVELVNDFAAFCAIRRPAISLELKIERLGPFFALVPTKPTNELNSLAAQAVRYFEPFRAPLNDQEIARRRPENLTEEQRLLLQEWGYPYVFDEFRFHMTLTGPVDSYMAPEIEAELEKRFSAVLTEPVMVQHLALFIERPTEGKFSLLKLQTLATNNTDEVCQ